MLKNKISDSYYDDISKGSLTGLNHFCEIFVCSLENFLKSYISKITDDTSRKINVLTELNDIQSIQLLLLRFEKTILKCGFFNELDFLDAKTKNHLNDFLYTQLTEYLTALKNHLKSLQEESNEQNIENLITQINRTKFIKAKKA